MPCFDVAKHNNVYKAVIQVEDPAHSDKEHIDFFSRNEKTKHFKKQKRKKLKQVYRVKKHTQSMINMPVSNTHHTESQLQRSYSQEDKTPGRSFMT